MSKLGRGFLAVEGALGCVRRGPEMLALVQVQTLPPSSQLPLDEPGQTGQLLQADRRYHPFPPLKPPSSPVLPPLLLDPCDSGYTASLLSPLSIQGREGENVLSVHFTVRGKQHGPTSFPRFRRWGPH